MAVVTNPVSVSPWTAEDRRPLEDMYEVFVPKDAAFGLPPSNLLRRQMWLDTLLTKGINVIARVGDQIIGHMVLMPDGNKAEMAMFVHQDFRCQGVARQLFRAAAQEMTPHGIDTMWAMVGGDNYACAAALRSFGFKTVANHGNESEMVYKL
jgi:L-amino acid N-acyltransferase YncA